MEFVYFIIIVQMLVLPFLFSIILIYGIFIYSYVNKNYNSIIILKDNIQSSPIYSISLSSTGICNEKKEIYPIGYFSGIRKGKFYKKKNIIWKMYIFT